MAIKRLQKSESLNWLILKLMILSKRQNTIGNELRVLPICEEVSCSCTNSQSCRMAPTLETEPSNYMQTLTRYLSNIMNSVLLGLPTEIKELIYFDALSHAATMILVRFLPLVQTNRQHSYGGVIVAPIISGS